MLNIHDGRTVCALLVIAVVLGADGAAHAATRIAAGGSHTCAVANGGGARCWGDNGSGQLGDGTQSTGVDASGRERAHQRRGGHRGRRVAHVRTH